MHYCKAPKVLKNLEKFILCKQVIYYKTSLFNLICQLSYHQSRMFAFDTCLLCVEVSERKFYWLRGAVAQW